MQARSLRIKDLSEFYSSDLFKNRGYELDRARRLIIKRNDYY